jgi:hypothetical protein
MRGDDRGRGRHPCSRFRTSAWRARRSKSLDFATGICPFCGAGETCDSRDQTNRRAFGIKGSLAGSRVTRKLAQTYRRTPGRIRICKLITAVGPEDETPLREKLREKLAALDEVNAPLPGSLEEAPLHLVAAQGLIPEAELLLKRGAKIQDESGGERFCGLTPLENACKAGQARMAEFLLQNGASFIKKTILPALEEGAKARVIQFPSALFYAVRSGSVETVEVLVRAGADPAFIDENDETLLHKAAEEGHAQMIHFLVKNGLDLEARRSCDFTALHVAVMAGHRDAVAELLRLGAKPDAKDDEGSTPLDLVPDAKKEIAKLLRSMKRTRT